MKNPSRLLRKSYAMSRMARAIERAVDAPTGKEKERAARWVAAWGMLCGIKTSTVRLRRSDVQRVGADRHHQGSDPIDIPSAAPAYAQYVAATGDQPVEASQQRAPSGAQSGMSDPTGPA
jgi:hypothetical protein